MKFILVFFLIFGIFIGNSVFAFGQKPLLLPNKALWEGDYYLTNSDPECPNQLRISVTESDESDNRCPAGKRTSIVGTYDASFGTIHPIYFSSLNCGIIYAVLPDLTKRATEAKLVNTTLGQAASIQRGYVDSNRISWREKSKVNLTKDGALIWESQYLQETPKTCSYRKF